jgi:putative transcriptional regulator
MVGHGLLRKAGADAAETARKGRVMDAVRELGGKLLIAMPGRADPRFDRSVIFICAHSDEGAMGLIINKPAEELSFTSLLEHLDIPHAPEGRDIRVHKGGPVERGRGFVLHSQDYPDGPATMEVPGGYRMTATLDILEALAQGGGPKAALLALGYSGWGPGQLESEIQRNDWLIAEAPRDLIFADNDKHKWTAALKLLGVDALTLSPTAGRA